MIDLDALRKDLEAATDGPWAADFGDAVHIRPTKEHGSLAIMRFLKRPTNECEANARLIARAPEMAETILKMAEVIEAAEEMAVDTSISADNIAHASKRDPAWEGVEPKLRARVTAFRTALEALK